MSQILPRCRPSYGFLDQDEADYQKGSVPINESGMLIYEQRKTVRMSNIKVIFNLTSLKYRREYAAGETYLSSRSKFNASHIVLKFWKSKNCVKYLLM